MSKTWINVQWFTGNHFEWTTTLKLKAIIYDSEDDINIEDKWSKL